MGLSRESPMDSLFFGCVLHPSDVRWFDFGCCRCFHCFEQLVPVLAGLDFVCEFLPVGLSFALDRHVEFLLLLCYISCRPFLPCSH